VSEKSQGNKGESIFQEEKEGKSSRHQKQGDKKAKNHGEAVRQLREKVGNSNWEGEPNTSKHKVILESAGSPNNDRLEVLIAGETHGSYKH
jgi:hypothetical protein